MTKHECGTCRYFARGKINTKAGWCYYLDTQNVESARKMHHHQYESDCCGGYKELLPGQISVKPSKTELEYERSRNTCELCDGTGAYLANKRDIIDANEAIEWMLAHDRDHPWWKFWVRCDGKHVIQCPACDGKGMTYAKN